MGSCRQRFPPPSPALSDPPLGRARSRRRILPRPVRQALPSDRLNPRAAMTDCRAPGVSSTSRFDARGPAWAQPAALIMPTNRLRP